MVLRTFIGHENGILLLQSVCTGSPRHVEVALKSILAKFIEISTDKTSEPSEMMNPLFTKLPRRNIQLDFNGNRKALLPDLLFV